MDSTVLGSSCKYDEREKRLRAIKILRLLLDYPLFREHLLTLLSCRNLQGQTPFNRVPIIVLRSYSTTYVN
jgi:hypothetical protein